MKRLFLLLMVFVLGVSSVACSKNNFSDNPDAIDDASKSVVKITTYANSFDIIAEGSGFCAFTEHTIVTNYHVIEGAQKIVITDDDDREVLVQNVYNVDKDRDIAILTLATNGIGYEPLELGESETLKKGENVVAIGSPLGIKNSISIGTISNFVEEDGIDMIQFTAAISSGSSGGALISDSGEVVGITSASYIDGQNLNLAVPSSNIIDLYNSEPLNVSVYDYYKENAIPTIKAGVLTVGISDFAPFVYIDENGKLTGIEIEILKAVAAELDLNIEFKLFDFNRLFAELESQDVDCIASGLECTPERNENGIYTKSVYQDVRDDMLDELNDIVFYVDKYNIKLLIAIDDAIEAIKDNGTLYNIFNKYGLN